MKGFESVNLSVFIFSLSSVYSCVEFSVCPEQTCLSIRGGCAATKRVAKRMERGGKPCCLTAIWLIEIEVGIRQRRRFCAQMWSQQRKFREKKEEKKARRVRDKNSETGTRN